MLTGCRLNEILTLRWDDVDRKAGEFRLRDAKTGARMVPLTPTAAAVMAQIVRVPRSPWVFAGSRPDRRLSQLTTYWHRVRERADTGIACGSALIWKMSGSTICATASRLALSRSARA